MLHVGIIYMFALICIELTLMRTVAVIVWARYEYFLTYIMHFKSIWHENYQKLQILLRYWGKLRLSLEIYKARTILYGVSVKQKRLHTKWHTLNMYLQYLFLSRMLIVAGIYLRSMACKHHDCFTTIHQTLHV